jgi:acetyltransferase-like isoleucine patch superfamily enzyme
LKGDGKPELTKREVEIVRHLDSGNTITSITNEVEDNAANAFKVAQSSNTYINVATTDSSEKVTIGNDLASIDNVVENNVANAFVVKEASNPYITIDTTNGSEKIKLQTAGNVEVSGITTIQNSTQTTNHTDGALVVAGGVGIGKNLWVSGSTTIMGDLTILGSSSIVNISASTLNIDDNIIRLNACAPFQRYAGIELMDSGSNNVSASLLWDSLSDYFLIASASGETGRVISTTYGTQGSEIGLTLNTIPKSTGGSAIGDSYLVDDGTKLSYYTDALIVTGSTGQTYIKGKVTLANVGGTDADSNTSAVLFRNSLNELGYISTTATTNVLTGILGYRESDGKLEFSSKIDGGYF